VTGTRSDRNKGMITLRAFVTLNLSAAAHKFYKINPLAPELFFLILAHPVYKI